MMEAEVLQAVVDATFSQEFVEGSSRIPPPPADPLGALQPPVAGIAGVTEGAKEGPGRTGVSRDEVALLTSLAAGTTQGLQPGVQDQEGCSSRLRGGAVNTRDSHGTQNPRNPDYTRENTTSGGPPPPADPHFNLRAGRG